jgi:2-dehydropantoate 2-reductase
VIPSFIFALRTRRSYGDHDGNANPAALVRRKTGALANRVLHNARASLIVRANRTDTRMRICVIGAGSIGGLLAASLHAAGEDMSVVARGAHLAAIRSHGLRLIRENGSEIVARIAASDRIGDMGVQDLVILGMKAHQVAAVIDDLPALCGPDTMILSAQNGIPWWYFLKSGGPNEGRVLESVDPGGIVTRGIDPARIIGSVVYPAAEIAAPGVIRHIEGLRFSLSEVDGKPSARIAAVSEAFAKAGFKAPISSDIRAEIWLKLWGNLVFNPVSALTHATLAGMCAFAPTRELAVAMMQEAQQIAEALGVRIRVSIEKRIAGAAAVGEHKPSMLQDVEAGRALEIDALLGAVLELGRVTEISTPHIATVHACAKLLGETLATQRARLILTPA